MPEAHYVWLPRESLLTFEELDRVAGIFVGLGVRRIRLTGGEPLLRHGLPDLVGRLARRSGLADLALTTNGALLADHALALREAGLARVTVSLDTLRPERLRAFSRVDCHAEVLAGLSAAQRAGFRAIKLNSVIVRGFNDDEVMALLDFARERGIELRYIEYMDVGGATRWRREDVVTRAELRTGADDRAIAALIASTWEDRSDRGAEDRLGLADRGALYQVAGLREDPRREMHTRGG
jgi:cyclic pyranopterin phosphate synthase